MSYKVDGVECFRVERDSGIVWVITINDNGRYVALEEMTKASPDFIRGAMFRAFVEPWYMSEDDCDKQAQLIADYIASTKRRDNIIEKITGKKV